MKTSSSLNSAKGYFALGLIVLWLASGSLLSYAHNGSVMAPTVVAGSINITDASIEGAWGAGMPFGLLANDCADFMAMSGATVTAYTANDGTNLFVAFDIPDQSANAADALFLFFDPTPGVAGGATTTAADDRAFRFPFGDTSGLPIDLSATAATFTGAGAPNNWSAPVAGLPAGVQAFYRRDTGANKYQFEARFAFSALPGITTGSGFAFVYMNRTNLSPTPPPAGGDCTGAGVLTDFYVKSPGLPVFGLSAQLPKDVGDPSQWQDLGFGPLPPTVGFQAPLCCGSSDIDFSPATQPFTAGAPVNIRAKPHNLSTTTTANNVNVEIRVHNFGTGGGGSVVFTSGPPAGPNSAQVPSIPPSSGAFTNFVVWPSPPAGLHGCIRAEIKPATVSPYLIAAGSETAQHNIDVACVGQGMKKDLHFNVFNPDKRQEGLKITLIKQELQPAGGGLHFDLEQPVRPLRPEEEMPVRLTVTADSGAPLTDVSAVKVTVPPTAGGGSRGTIGATPANGRPGEQARLAAFAQIASDSTTAVAVDVKSGERLHLTATGEVDLDGAGPLPAAPPDGKDFSSEMREGQFLLDSPSANRFAGALLGSFDNFQHAFIIGSEGTVTVPEKVEKLFLAVNDLIEKHGDNTGSGFAVNIGRLPAVIAPAARASGGQGGQPATAVAIPQVNIAAVSTSTVSVAGTEIVYHVATNLGGVTYQVVVMEGAAGGGGMGSVGTDKKRLYIYLLILLLILLLLFFTIRWLTRRRHAS